MTGPLGRRSFVKGLSGAALVLTGNNCRPTEMQSGQRISLPQGQVFLESSEGQIRLGNEQIILGFDLASGSLTDLKDVPTGRRIEIAAEAAAPLRLWMGTPEEPDLHELAVARSRQQKLEYQLWKSEEELCLSLYWPSLGNGQLKAGPVVRQTYTLSAADNSVRIRSQVENRTHHWLTGLFLGCEALQLNPDPGKERLKIGDYRGEFLENPRQNLPEGRAYVPIPEGKRAFSVPPTVPTGLVSSWLDLSAPDRGLGTGYLDAQGMDLVGYVEARPAGLTLGWRLFRLEGSHGFMWDVSGPRQIYPLAPGEHFISDEWILVVHEGDWHGTAEAYRRRYEVAFQGDFLDWETTSPVVKNCDIAIDSQIAWGEGSKDRARAYDYPRGKVIHRFEELPPLVERTIKDLKVAPENTVLLVLGTAPNWGIYRMPDHFPLVEEAGGQKAGEKMCRDVKALGIGGICFYAHPYFLHRKAENYLAAADSGLNYPHMDWHTSMGSIACMAAEEWQKLWEERLYPQFVALGVEALYWDEGFGHQLICQQPDHDHGVSALGVLTAQMRGAHRLYDSWRKMAGPRAFLLCESGSDVQARFIDLWHYAKPTETMRFTHPDKLMINEISSKDLQGSVGRAFVFGCPLMVRSLMEGGQPLAGEALQAVQKFVQLRHEMRTTGAPGYPQGFRDNIGLEVSDQHLLGKVYVGTGGVTFVYYAAEDFHGEIIIRGSQLGHPGIGERSRTLKVLSNEMGYFVLATA